MKLIYIYNEKWECDYIKSGLSDAEIIFSPDLEGSKEHWGDVEMISVFANSILNNDVLRRMPNLRFIAARSTGLDHIDLEYVKEKGIVVSSTPAYGKHTVAEYTFALLLCLSRKIFDAYKQIEEGGSFSQKNLRGFDLHGKTLGVVGTGSIGTNVIKIAKGFGMNIIANAKSFDNEKAERLGFEYKSFEEVLSGADIITLHTPYNTETHHMINMGNIEKIKKGAYLVNAARGGLVETRALVEALEKGILAGAAIDVLEEEGYMNDELKLLTASHPQVEELRTILSNHYLIDHPRVIITPHNAFNTEEAILKIIDTTIENIKNFQGGNPSNVING